MKIDKNTGTHEYAMLEAWDKAREMRYQARMSALNAFVCKMWVVVWLGGCALLTVFVAWQFFGN